jgi:tRNA (cmo5U34)-methyltransferase
VTATGDTDLGRQGQTRSRTARGAGAAHSPGATWQRPELVEPFLAERQTLVPLIDIQEDLVKRLFERHARPIERFLDLGCGDGALSELMLAVAPGAEAVLVDFSEPMLARVESRLGRRGRWRAVRGDLSDPAWLDALPDGAYGAAVSSLAIHHLPAERKRALYREVFELLEGGAMFVNMDYVAIDGPLRGLWDEQMLSNALRGERSGGGARSAAELERDLFDDSDEDRPDSVEEQVQWLRDAGFEDAEVHFKWAEGAVFGGARPR